MNLIIDTGNTFSKIDVFDNENILASTRVKVLSVNNIKKFLAKNKLFNHIDAAILSSVANTSEDVIHFLKNNFFFIFFNAQTPVPIESAYSTPNTLGPDRLAAAVAAAHLFPKKNVLSIDMGTCVTYDFINSNNQYLGGAISPGLAMRFKALNTFTQKLPLVKLKKIKFLIGQNTEDSILSGVINGMSLEIKGMISNYVDKYTELQVILSGGDIKNFDNNLKISIFADSNIVTLGLNIILNYNRHQ